MRTSRKPNRERRSALVLSLVLSFIFAVASIVFFSITLATMGNGVSQRISSPDLNVTQTQEVILGPDGMLNAGDVIRIESVMRNTGNTLFRNISIVDNFPVGTMCLHSGAPALVVAELFPGATLTCIGMHVITQNDIDAGVFSLSSTFVVNGVESGDLYPIQSTSSLLQSTFGELSVAVMIETPIEEIRLFVPGDKLNVLVKLFNSGTETLLNVTSSSLNGTVIAQLLPMEMYMFHYNYTVSFEELEAMSTNLTETAQGIGRTSANPVTGSFTVTADLTNILFNLAIIDHQLSYAPECISIGQTLDISFTVKNTGTVPINNVAVSHTLAGFNIVCGAMGVGLSIGTLFPGEEQICLGAYLIQAGNTVFGQNTTLSPIASVSAPGLVTAFLPAQITIPGQDTKFYVWPSVGQISATSNQLADRMEWPWMRRPPRVWDLGEMCLCGSGTTNSFFQCHKNCPKEVIKTVALFGSDPSPFRFDACKLPIHHGDILVSSRSSFVGLIENSTCHNDLYWILRHDIEELILINGFVFPRHMHSESFAAMIKDIFGSESYWEATYKGGWERNAEKKRYQARTFTFVLCLLKRLGFSKDLRSIIAPLVFSPTQSEAVTM